MVMIVQLSESTKKKQENKKQNPVYLRPGNVHLKQVLKMILRPLRFENCSISFVITLSPENSKNLKSYINLKKAKSRQPGHGKQSFSEQLFSCCLLCSR